MFYPTLGGAVAPLVEAECHALRDAVLLDPPADVVVANAAAQAIRARAVTNIHVELDINFLCGGRIDMCKCTASLAV